MVLLPNSLLKRVTELEFAGEVVDTDPSTGFAPGDKIAGFIAPDTVHFLIMHNVIMHNSHSA